MLFVNKGKWKNFCIPETLDKILMVGKQSPNLPNRISMKLFQIIFFLLALSFVSTIAPAAYTYPLNTCVVSGEELGTMGQPIIFHHEGAEVRLCCKGCLKKFNADPAKYLEKLNCKPPQG